MIGLFKINAKVGIQEYIIFNCTVILIVDLDTRPVFGKGKSYILDLKSSQYHTVGSNGNNFRFVIPINDRSIETFEQKWLIDYDIMFMVGALMNVDRIMCHRQINGSLDRANPLILSHFDGASHS